MPLLQSSSSLKTKHLPLNRFSFFLGFLFVSLAAVAAFYLGLPLNFIPNLSLKALAILSSVVGALGAFALFSLGYELKKKSVGYRPWPTMLLGITLMSSFALYAAFEVTTGLLGLRIAIALGTGALATYTALSPLAIEIGRMVKQTASPILILPLALSVMGIFLAVGPTPVAQFLWHYPVLLALTATVLVGLGVGVLGRVRVRDVSGDPASATTEIEMGDLSDPLNNKAPVKASLSKLVIPRNQDPPSSKIVEEPASQNGHEEPIVRPRIQQGPLPDSAANPLLLDPETSLSATATSGDSTHSPHSRPQIPSGSNETLAPIVSSETQQGPLPDSAATLLLDPETSLSATATSGDSTHSPQRPRTSSGSSKLGGFEEDDEAFSAVEEPASQNEREELIVSSEIQPPPSDSRRVASTQTTPTILSQTPALASSAVTGSAKEPIQLVIPATPQSGYSKPSSRQRALSLSSPSISTDFFRTSRTSSPSLDAPGQRPSTESPLDVQSVESTPPLNSGDRPNVESVPTNTPPSQSLEGFEDFDVSPGSPLKLDAVKQTLVFQTSGSP